MSVRIPTWSVYDIFESSDGEQVFVGVVSDSMWKRFCEEFELRDLAADHGLDTNYERVLQRDRILAIIRALFASMNKSEMIERLERAGLPFAPVNRPSDLLDDPHMNAAGGLLEVTLSDGESAGQKIRLPAIPVEMDGQKFGVRKDLPTEGADSVEILQEVGYSSEEIQLLLDQGLVKDS